MPTAENRSDARSIEAVRALARASRLLEHSAGGVSLAQYRVLSAIAAGDERASRIAARLALGKPTVSATVDSLCQRGLLTRGEVAGDQRAAALRLTSEGQTVLATLETGMTGRLEDLAARTPDAQQVMQSMVWLGAAIDELATERLTAQGRR